MPVSKNRQFAKIANDVATDGTLTAEAISSDVTLGGATIYATRSVLPVSGNTAGDQAYVTGNNRLYIWNGSGWYNVALLNLAPSITSVQDSDGNTTPFSLALDGTATTITITATDSDGDPVTFSSTADSDFAGLATLSQDSSVFTITPFSQDSATTTSGTITFTASDGINLGTSGVQTFTLNFVSTLWDETVLSIGTSSTDGLANGTFIDRSTNAHTVTPTGTPVQTAFHPYLDNWSVEFDGTDDYLTFADDTNWDFVNSGDFTVDSWIYPRTSSNIAWFGQSGGGGSRPDKWGVYINDTSVGLTAGTIGWHLGSNGNIQGPSFTPTANTWYHIRLGRAGDVWYFFVDGVLLGTATSAIRPSVSGGTLRIGSDGESYRDFNGYLSNVRIVKGTNLNTTSFTPITENLTAVTNTVLLICQSNRFVDNSSNSYTATFSGTPKVSAYSPFGQGSDYVAGENKGSAFFDEASSEYLIADLNTLNSIDTTWTIECWAYPTIDGSPEYIIGFNGKDGGNDYIVGVTASYLNGASTGTQAAYILRGQWNHVAITCDGTTITLWINGVSRETVQYTSANPLSNCVAAVGCEFDSTNGGGPGNYFNGYISDWGVSDTCKYTTEFTPPTSPVSADADVLYVPMDNAGIFDKTGNNTLTLVGNASTSTTQTKYADTAMYFDGTGDSIIIEDNDLFDFGESDFTIEMWLYNNSTSNMGIFGKRETNTQYGTTNLDINGGKIRFLISLNNGGWVSTSQTTFTVPSNQWYHLALVRDTSSSTLTCYANGNNVGQITSFTGSFVNTAYPFIVGNSVENTTEPPFNGYIENFQVLNGVAKYTSNFTPPTQEQGRSHQAES